LRADEGVLSVTAIVGAVAEGDKSLGVRTGNIVKNIKVVGCLLKEEAFAAAAKGVPVLKIEIAAHPNEMPNPDRSDFTELPGCCDFMHFLVEGMKSEVKSDLKGLAGVTLRLEHRIAVRQVDGHRFFAKNWLAGF